MAQKKVYRSALRSKAWIREAFMQLLQEKNYEKITVTDIVNRAGINRSTFYAHYADVFALVEEIRDEVLAAAVGPLEECLEENIFVNPKPYLQMLSRLISENQQLYRLLGKIDILHHQLDWIKRYLVNHSLEKLELPQSAKDNRSLQLRVTFFVGGIVDMYLNWIQGQLDCTLEDVTDEVAQLIAESVSAVLGLASGKE